MCGLAGVISASNQTLTPAAEQAVLAALHHRGPDDRSVARFPGLTLLHTRLAIIDPTNNGRQPMRCTERGRDTILVYNGELYNDREVRTELASLGWTFRTGCDTETVLAALTQWGRDALPRLRGMYALAFFDAGERTLLLARDPLGVKPLFIHATDTAVSFASEPRALLAMPHIDAKPDLLGISAYLTTIRTTLGSRTMFEGIEPIPPGTSLELRFTSDRIERRAHQHWQGGTIDASLDRATTIERTRASLEDSVARHLRSDVPVCCLLSGGLDSTVTTHLARRDHPSLRSYCAGDPAPVGDEAAHPTDLDVAREAAAQLGTDHAEAHLDEHAFRERWSWMVREMRTPLGTPNEVAIYTVASRLRSDGCIVTISGEGADELFAGYETPIRAALEHAQAGDDAISPGRFALLSTAWIAPELKPALLRPELWSQLDEDAALFDEYERTYAAAAHTAGDDGLPAAVGLLRRINLVGLLQRLDSAAMLASVEGRTPFADAKVAALAESLPMHHRFAIDDDGTVRTKIALREAFRPVLPGAVVDRPKASFPLPFQRWCAPEADRLLSSPLLRELCQPGALAAVAGDPKRHWNLTWPLINLAMWSETF